jgi:predicted nucleic acid-binding protein
VASVVVDDHLLRDILTGERTSDLGGLAPDGIATTGLWLFRLCSSLADPEVVGKLSGPVAELSPDVQDRFRAQITALPDGIEVLPMRELSWTMALLQHRHRSQGRGMSTAMVEALAAAHQLNAGIAVSTSDVGPNLRDSAIADGIAFHAL